MRYETKLRIGDWVVTTNDLSKGKFQFGEITSHNFKKIFELDLKKLKIKEQGCMEMTGKGYINILNESELKKLLRLKTKFGIVEELESSRDDFNRGEAK